MPAKTDPVVAKGDKTPTMATGGPPVTLGALMAALTRMQMDQATANAAQANATQLLRQELLQQIQDQADAVQNQVQNQDNGIQLLRAVIPPPDPNQGNQGLINPAQQQGQARTLRCLDINGLLKLPPRPSSLQHRDWLSIKPNNF